MSNFLFISPDQHFAEVLQEAYAERRLKPDPYVDIYLIQLLKHYLESNNLFKPFAEETSTEKAPETLAELYMIGVNAPSPKNREFMKVLADRSLYLSGFFGESLQKKLIDLDYYAEIGSAAYTHLATWTKEDQLSHTYKIFSEKFCDIVDVLSYVSEKSSIQGDQNILRLYEKYVKTGSEVARDRLHALGVLTVAVNPSKSKKVSN